MNILSIKYLPYIFYLNYYYKLGDDRMIIKKIFFRIYQFISSKFQIFLPWRKPELIIGENSLNTLSEIIKKDAVDKVFIITTKGFIKRGTINLLLDELNKVNIQYYIFDKAMPNPTVESVEISLLEYNINKCQSIIAFGGGSVIDLGKALGARIANPDKNVNQMAGLLKVRKKIPTLYAIPTTAGTGSEATVASVITDEKTNHKYAINDLVLIPKYAVLYPELTIGLTPFLTATTGMDALTHAIESYTNKFNDEESREYAKKAVKLIFENLEKAYYDGDDIEARKNMLMASYYAGIAFTRAYVGNVHAIAHTLGGLYNVPHGLANAIILPKVLREYGENIYSKLSQLADLVGIYGNSTEEKAINFIVAIEKMNKNMEIPTRIENTIKDKDIEKIIDWAIKEANPTYPVPVIWNRDEYRKIINEIK